MPKTPADSQAASGAAMTALRSMTGFGRVTLDGKPRVTAEIRSVNGRFLKLSVKLPGRYAALEERVKSLLAEEGLKRGNVDVSLFYDGAGGDEASYAIDAEAVKRYAQQARAVSRKQKVKNDLGISALLPLPGVIRREEYAEHLDTIWAVTEKALRQALADFNAMRQREGAALAADVRVQLRLLGDERAAIKTAAPQAQQNAVQRFKERVGKLLEQQGVNAPVSNEALEREIVLLADRMDIGEELARLQSHLEQVEATLRASGETGKRLDFLTQELFRETNTIGSKAQDEQITHRVITMKGLIEKIREQVQNLE